MHGFSKKRKGDTNGKGLMAMEDLSWTTYQLDKETEMVFNVAGVTQVQMYSQIITWWLCK